MTTKFAVIEKDLRTDRIVAVVEFSSRADAEDYVEEMMDVYEEERAYKIVAGVRDFINVAW